MTGRSFVLSIAITAIVFGIGGRCTAPAPRGLPAPVARAVERHAAASAVDTANINRLEREKAAAKQRELAASRARQAAEDSAAVQSRRADSLEAVARAATTAADSADAWRTAYYVRTGEAEDLQIALAESKGETRGVQLQLAAAEAQAASWKAGKLRGDTVIAQLLPLAETAGDRCRILHVLQCPPRKAVLAAGFVAGVAVGIRYVRLP